MSANKKLLSVRIDSQLDKKIKSIKNSLEKKANISITETAVVNKLLEIGIKEFERSERGNGKLEIER